MKITRKKGKKIIVAIVGTLTAIATATIILNLTFIRRLLTYPKCLTLDLLRTRLDRQLWQEDLSLLRR